MELQLQDPGTPSPPATSDKTASGYLILSKLLALKEAGRVAAVLNGAPAGDAAGGAARPSLTQGATSGKAAMARNTVRNDVQMLVTCRLSNYLTFRPALCDVEHEAALQHPHSPSSSAGVAVYCTLCRYCVSTTGHGSGSDPSFWLQRDCGGQNARRAERPTDKPGARAQLSAFTTGTQSQRMREPAHHMQHHAEHW